MTSSAIRNEISTNQSLEKTENSEPRKQKESVIGYTEKTEPSLFTEMRSAVSTSIMNECKCMMFS